jgi:serine-type D-Ala-D-Ala endopeptidase (penicillin-binding protein 7)
MEVRAGAHPGTWNGSGNNKWLRNKTFLLQSGLSTLCIPSDCMRPLSGNFVRSLQVGVACLMAVLIGGSALDAAQAKRHPSKTVSSTGPAVGKAPAKTAGRYSASSSRARRARLRQARAAAKARELTVARTPKFKIDESGDLVPDVRAEAALIYSPATGRILWESGGFDQRSIASITKVMTALCFLDDNPDLSREVMIDRTDLRAASTTFLRASERLRLQDVLHLALVASDNVAARTLARNSSAGAEAFVGRMNEKAVELGLTSTRFADPSGLDARNVSSAYDLARLIAYAAEDELISSIMRTSEYTFHSSRRVLTIHNTNQLVRAADIEVVGGKTGFTNNAGHCLATLLRLPEFNQSVAVVVLGARSNAGRFWETRHLFNWIAGKAHSLFLDQLPQGPQHLPGENQSPRSF